VAEPVKKHWTTHIGQAAGHPAAFLVVILYAGLWLVFSPATFEWNAVATLAVFMMTLFIQRTNRRDNLALHAKLDELLRVDQDARSELVQLDEQEPEAIERHRDEEVRKSGAEL
jgi:low affinity Fe/Cu permease